jgi:hypothetical protein
MDKHYSNDTKTDNSSVVDALMKKYYSHDSTKCIVVAALEQLKLNDAKPNIEPNYGAVRYMNDIHTMGID